MGTLWCLWDMGVAGRMLNDDGIVNTNLTYFLVVFNLCFSHLGYEGFATLQGTKTYTGSSTAVVDVALPVSTHNDTAVTIIPTASIYFVGSAGSDLCQKQ